MPKRDDSQCEKCGKIFPYNDISSYCSSVEYEPKNGCFYHIGCGGCVRKRREVN